MSYCAWRIGLRFFAFVLLFILLLMHVISSTINHPHHWFKPRFTQNSKGFLLVWCVCAWRATVWSWALGLLYSAFDLWSGSHYIKKDLKKKCVFSWKDHEFFYWLQQKISVIILGKFGSIFGVLLLTSYVYFLWWVPRILLVTLDWCLDFWRL